MRRLALVLPLFFSDSACEWLSGPEHAPGVWRATHVGYSYAKPALLGDTLFVATGDGQVIARLAQTGARLWSAKVGSGRVWGANLVVTAGAVVAPVLYETRAVDAHSGQPLWTYRAPLDTVGGRPSDPGAVANVHLAVSDSAVFIPSWGGTVAAIQARTGSVLWQWAPPALPFRFGAQGVALDGTRLFVILWHYLDTFGNVSEGRVVALDRNTGAELWQTVLPNLEIFVCVKGAPAIAGAVVAVATVNGRVYGLNRATGAILWSLAQDTLSNGGVFYSLFSGATASNDTVYADAGTNHLRAISASTGKVLWRAPYDGQFGADMTLSASRIYAPDGRYLLVFDRRTGQLVHRLADASGLFAASVALTPALVFAPVAGAVWAFEP